MSGSDIVYCVWKDWFNFTFLIDIMKNSQLFNFVLYHKISK